MPIRFQPSLKKIVVLSLNTVVMRPFLRSPRSSASTETDFKETNKWKEYCNLESIPTEKSDRSTNTVQPMLAFIEKLWKAIATLTKEPQLKVWQTQDRDGHTRWHVCDPKTHESVAFVSETALYDWLQSRYCR